MPETTIVENPPEEGYVYFAYCPELYAKGTHHIKIGFTKDLNKRIKQLQTGNSFEIQFYKTHKSTDYKTVETKLHQKYKEKQVRNEWFNLTLKDVDLEINILEPPLVLPTEHNQVIKIIFKIWKKISSIKG